MKIVNIKNKEIKSDKLQGVIVQDERNIQPVQFTLTDESLVDLMFYLLYRNPDGTGGVEYLQKTVIGADISLLWNLSHTFTNSSGTKQIQVIAVDNNDYTIGDNSTVRWSTLYCNVVLGEDIEPSELAPDAEQTMIEDLICEALDDNNSN